MFTNVEVLDKNKHIDLRFNPVNNYNFAKNLTSVPLTIREVAQASVYYPIIFSPESILPRALLGLYDNQNAYIDEQGSWKAGYIPAHIRRYPFILGKPDEGNEYAVCIDRDAPHFQESQGDLLYNANGEPTELLTKAKDFLSHFQRDLMATEKVLQPLIDKEVLVSHQFNLNIQGKKTSVGGFRAVDQNKMKDLTDDVLSDWVRQGIYGIIIAHLNSFENVNKIMNQRSDS